MNCNSLTRRPKPLCSIVALVFAATGAVAATGADDGSSAGDYRQFHFSASKPYFEQGGKVDFGTYNGFRRYHSECHTCHGPAGLGSSYAPSLVKAVQALSFHEFVDVIVRGRQGQENFVMPGFAENMNVLPYLDDLYAYLKARSDNVLGAARPPHFPKVDVNRALAGGPAAASGGAAKKNCARTDADRGC